MNCWYLIILLFLCGVNCNSSCNGGSLFSGGGCGGCGQRSNQKSSKRERGCDDEKIPRYGSCGCDDDMMQTRAFAGFSSNGTCGCEEKRDDECGCENS